MYIHCTYNCITYNILHILCYLGLCNNSLGPAEREQPGEDDLDSETLRPGRGREHLQGGLGGRHIFSKCSPSSYQTTSKSQIIYNEQWKFREGNQQVNSLHPKHFYWPFKVRETLSLVMVRFAISYWLIFFPFPSDLLAFF